MRGVAALLVLACAVAAEQVPLQAATKKRELKGRFLHITDFHPDPHYKTGASFDSGCHRKPGDDRDKARKGKSRLGLKGDDDRDDDGGTGGVAGKWGSAVTECDSPMSLMEVTFDWLKKEWAGEVDFIVWTGDSARHDIDRLLPRSGKEIFDLNRWMTNRMIDTFGKKVPIIPSIGNNDIYPHNIMDAGPNRITEEFLRIWKKLIPEEERHVFERGAYFAVEIIPDQLAAISLNTIYWYNANSAVDGCKLGSQEPGALQMDWLEVQLQMFRDRGMQVHLIGHVPPHAGMYYDDCFLRYGDLVLRFQDTIVGQFYGHMNIDHFFFINVNELEAVSIGSASLNSSIYLETPHEDQLAAASVDDFSYPGPELRHGEHLLNSGRFKIMGKKGDSLKKALQQSFKDLPDPEKLKHKDYSLIHVAPSVIPTYIPSARVYSYNLTGVTIDSEMVINLIPDDIEDQDVEALKKKKKGCERPENQNKPHCTFKRKPRYSSPESPSRSNQPLSLLGYTQFFLPDVDKQTKKPPKWEIEYTTFKGKSLLPPSLRDDEDAADEFIQPPPVPYHMLPGFDPEIVDFTPEEVEALDNDEAELSSRKDKKSEFLAHIKRITPWKLHDLTIKSYTKFARKLLEDKKAWKKFVDFMFVSSGGD